MREGRGSDRAWPVLRKTAEFKRVFERGRKDVSRRLVVWALHTPGGSLRSGVVASRKVGNAVVRNRCKRRMRELVRSHLPSLAPGHEFVLIARSGLESCPWPEAVADFQSACRRLGLLVDSPSR